MSNFEYSSIEMSFDEDIINVPNAYTPWSLRCKNSRKFIIMTIITFLVILAIIVGYFVFVAIGHLATLMLFSSDYLICGYSNNTKCSTLCNAGSLSSILGICFIVGCYYSFIVGLVILAIWALYALIASIVMPIYKWYKNKV